MVAVTSVHSAGSRDLCALFTAARSRFDGLLTTMDLLAAMARGADGELSGCGDAEAWARIAERTKVDVGALPGQMSEAAWDERRDTPVHVVIGGESFQVSKAVDRSITTAQLLLRHYCLREMEPWLLAAAIALEGSNGSRPALIGAHSRVWLAQLFLRELALAELGGLDDLLEGRPGPPERETAEAQDEGEISSESAYVWFHTRASRSLLGNLHDFRTLAPRLCRRRDRAVRTAVVIPLAALAFTVTAPVVATTLTMATAAASSYVKGKSAVAGVLALTAWLVGAPWWLAIVALPVGLALRPCAAAASRPFVGRLSGWRTVLLSSGRRRAERFVAHAYPVSAMAEYDLLIARTHGRRLSSLLADAAYAACAAEQYQRAFDLATLGLQTCSSGSRHARRVRAKLDVATSAACVALGQVDRVRAQVKTAISALHLNNRLLNQTLIAMGQVEGTQRHADAVRNIAITAATRALRRLRWLPACEYMVDLGQFYLWKRRPADAWICFYNAHLLVEQRYFSHFDEYSPSPEYGAWRPVSDILARAELGLVEAQLAAGFSAHPEDPYDVSDPSSGLEQLKSLERPLDLARAHQLYAAIRRRDGLPEKAARHLFAALGIIDRNRYLIRDPETRLQWIKANLQAHRSALAAMHQSQDHAGVCELLETGRLQGIPALLQDATAGSSGMEIPLQPPPRVMIAGASHLIDADGVGADTRTVDLQDLVRRIAGQDGLLLSYWNNEDGCYWALLGLESIHSGRFDLADPQLASALAAVRQGLPSLLDGETPEARTSRLRAGPYYSDRAREEEIATALSVVLPLPLRRHLAMCREKTASVIICPSPELAQLPWPLIAVPEAASPEAAPPPRLLDLADLHLGLTSALNHEILQRPAYAYTTDVSVVVDPGGDGAGPEGENTSSGSTGLRHAREMALTLPGQVRIHGGRWRGDGNPTTLDRLRQILRAVPRGGTFAFVGHCANPDPGRSAVAAALVLAPSDSPGTSDQLTAHSLLRQPDDEQAILFPTRVILAACNTSSADKSDAGEWLSLVPAVHWAGAHEVVSSTVPVPDILYRLERELIGWLSEDSTVTLSHMLLTLQRDALRRWRAGERNIPPVIWAFYMHSGLPGNNSADRDEAAPSEEMIWHPRAVEKLQGARKAQIVFTHRVLHTYMVALSHIGYEVDDAESWAALYLVFPLEVWEMLGFGHNPIPLPPGRAPRLSNDWPLLIEAAEDHARAHCRRMVCEIDVLSALLSQRNLSGSWLMRRLAAVRHTAVRDRMIREAHAAPQWLHSRPRAWSDGGERRRPDPSVTLWLDQLGFTEQWLRRNQIACRRATFDRGFCHYDPIRPPVQPTPKTTEAFQV